MLRWVMVEAAQTHVHRCDTSITRAYNRIAERKGKKIATVAAALKLLMCSFSVLKNKWPYYDQTQTFSSSARCLFGVYVSAIEEGLDAEP